MKKLIGILGIALLGWLGAYIEQNSIHEKAWAGITCSLPIVLLNGTTADAGQVMQNFNQLASCFNSVATVNQVTCGPGLDGGIITGSGTCSLSAARRTNPTVQSFLGGSGTYQTPTNAIWLEVHMVGGGGGGVGLNTSPGGVQVGVSGGNSTFGAAAVAQGGTSGGGGGGTSSCTVGISGGSGHQGVESNTGGITGVGGAGGTTIYGGAGIGGIGIAGQNASANSGAGGGGGGYNTSATVIAGAGGGAGGYCYLLITNPAASYSYAVGAGGAGGIGTFDTGGQGAAGSLYVIEHYN